MYYTIKELAEKPYRPANGTEGEMFKEWFCDKCRAQEKEKLCEILSCSMMYEINEIEYPAEWTHNDKGQPICIAFEQKN
jgi:hypothetical protein